MATMIWFAMPNTASKRPSVLPFKTAGTALLRQSDTSRGRRHVGGKILRRLVREDGDAEGLCDSARHASDAPQYAGRDADVLVFEEECDAWEHLDRILFTPWMATGQPHWWICGAAVPCPQQLLDTLSCPHYLGCELEPVLQDQKLNLARHCPFACYQQARPAIDHR